VWDGRTNSTVKSDDNDSERLLASTDDINAKTEETDVKENKNTEESEEEEENTEGAEAKEVGDEFKNFLDTLHLDGVR
jgi:hypothetical protein